MHRLDPFADGSFRLRLKMNRLAGGVQSLQPMFGGRMGGVMSNASGTTTQPSISQIRPIVGDTSRRRVVQGQIKGLYTGIGPGETGWYLGAYAQYQGKPNTLGLLDNDFNIPTGTISFCNLNEVLFASSSGVNFPPQLNLNGPLIVTGDMSASDQNIAGGGSKKMVIGSFLDAPPSAPGVIVTSGPSGQSNFSTTSTGPQQYWVQQAYDSSSDTTGEGTVTLSGISNAPTWAVTDIGSGGFRLPAGTPVRVDFGFNPDKTLKCWINTQQYFVYPVQLMSDGSGSLGTDSSQSSWKYYLKNPITGTYIGASSGSGQSPEVGRTNGTFAAASWGFAYNNSSNVPTLIIAFELPGTTHC